MINIKPIVLELLERPKFSIRTVWFCRYPILFSLILILIGPLGLLFSATILGNGFLLCNYFQMCAITVISMICATLLLMQILVMLDKAPQRFSDLREPSPVTQEEAPERKLRRAWNWNAFQTIYWVVSGFTFPITCWIHSMHQAGGSFPDEPELSFEAGLLGLILGVGAYFLLLQVAASIDHLIAPDRRRQSFFPTDALAKFSVPLNETFKDVKNQIQHGHFELALSFVLLLVFYVGCYAWTRGAEMTPEDSFTAPFYLVLSITIVSMALSALSFFLDYYRISTVLVLIAVLFVWNYGSDFDHRFPVIRIGSSSALVDNGDSQSAGSPNVDASVVPHRSSDGSALPSAGSAQNIRFVVVAPGGGIHASAWTGKVLTGLHERYEEKFASNLKLISAVSGGAVGTMFYLDFYPTLRMASRQAARDAVVRDAAQAKFRSSLNRAFNRSSTSSLEALAWGATFPDTARMFLGSLIQEDRGMVQERRWLRRMDIGPNDGSGHTLGDWITEAKSNNMPYVVFNATEAETGRRILFSTYRFQPEASLPLEARAIDFISVANNQFDLPVSTAVRLSATFPYASAAAMPAKDTLPLGHVVDGGYVDNEGLLTAVEFIRQERASFEERKKKHDAKQTGSDKVVPFAEAEPKYVILRILHSPPVEDRQISPTDPGFSGSGWEYASLGPLLAMSNVRVTSQRERGEIELQLLMDQMKDNLTSVVLQFTPPEGYYAPPLNWKLSPKQRTAYATAWESLTSSADQSLIERRKPSEKGLAMNGVATDVTESSKSEEQGVEKKREYTGLEWLDKLMSQ